MKVKYIRLLRLRLPVVVQLALLVCRTVQTLVDLLSVDRKGIRRLYANLGTVSRL